MPLTGDVDLEHVLASVENQGIKGMFLARHAEEVWDDVHRELAEPPSSRAKYHAFEWYPMADYVRVFDRAARARFPGSLREAYRLLARSEIEVFAATTLGKVTMSMLGEPGAALMRYPDILGLLWSGPRCKAERVTPNRVKISFQESVGAALEHVLGVLEGIVTVFGAKPETVIEIDATGRPSFDIVW